jgi:hypothetical protein
MRGTPLILQLIFIRKVWFNTPLRIKRKNFSKNIGKYFRHTAGCFNLGGLKLIFAIFRDMLRSGKNRL